ncbi:MAG: flagellar protein G [Halodesulfurarchaeum sp.]
MAIVSSETLIIFIAAVLVAGSVAGALTGGVNQLSEALSERSVDVSQEIRTDVAIISDSGSDEIYDEDTDTVTLLVKNTGSTTLQAEPETLDVIINGVYRTNVDVTLIEEQDWIRGAVLRVEIADVELDQDTDHRVVLTVEGNQEVFEFRT